MNQEIKTKWLAALRSGKFTQGTGYLAKRHFDSPHYSHCCMGVLCEILELPTTCNGGKVKGYCDGSTEWLPDEAVRLAELPSGNPVTSKGQLTKLNDVDGLSFDEIADIIEKEL